MLCETIEFGATAEAAGGPFGDVRSARGAGHAGDDSSSPAGYRGYRSNRNFIAMIYLIVGKLNAGPVTA